MWYTRCHMKNPWVIIIAISIVLFGGAILFSGKSAEQNNEGVKIISHTKGNPEAPIKLVEYSDFQCPACAAFHPVIKEVLNEYGESIEFEYKHFPLPSNQYAMDAALAAEAAGQQGKFFEFHDLLFGSQKVWSESVSPELVFLQYADTLGLDVPTFKKHMNSSKLRNRVREQFNEARGLGVTGTPTFFLNGKRMQFQTYQEFIAQIAIAVDPTAAASTSTPTQTAEPAVRFGF